MTKLEATEARTEGARRHHTAKNEAKRKWVSDNAGFRFGKLEIVGVPVEDKRNGYYLVAVKCDCGARLTVARSALLRGRAKSCGCLIAEKASEMGERSRLEFGESTFRGLFSRYKKAARKRNLGFSLTLEEFRVISRQACHYCGSPPGTTVARNAGYGHYTYTGVDRVDNSAGYSAQNCVPCCKICNAAKGTLTLVEFLSWARKLYENSRDRYPDGRQVG